MTFITSMSNPLSLKSNPLMHRMPPKANSKTVAPLDFNSFELKLMRTSVAISLQANPNSIALRASAGSLLDERLRVLSAIVDEKNVLKEGGTLMSL